MYAMPAVDAQQLEKEVNGRNGQAEKGIFWELSAGRSYLAYTYLS